MLQKILEKIFFTKKFTQCKILRTLIDVFKIQDNKNNGKLCSKYELLFLDQANSSSDSSEILILRFLIPGPSLPLSPSLTETLIQHDPHLVLHRFPYFVLPYSTSRHHKYWIYQTIWQVKPIKFIIKLYPDHYIL